jgi:hypothetical protein
LLSYLTIHFEEKMMVTLADASSRPSPRLEAKAAEIGQPMNTAVAGGCPTERAVETRIFSPSVDGCYFCKGVGY